MTLLQKGYSSLSAIAKAKPCQETGDGRTKSTAILVIAKGPSKRASLHTAENHSSILFGFLIGGGAKG